MERPIFVAQYTFPLTLETVEEELRILGKFALKCRYVIRFDAEGKFYFLCETRSDYEKQFASYDW